MIVKTSYIKFPNKFTKKYDYNTLYELIADDNLYITQRTNVSIDSRVFTNHIYLGVNEDINNYIEISQVEYDNYQKFKNTINNNE